ncbi:PH domain-containing protein [Clostridium sp. D2Q-11]|uniref:PH domain-containing protein n=1 Tax=Anaeromonas frigoriresistens TaxID=2683708 RepID=A0A942Z7P6_9FIRM|nr:PH domain-containing protein [Anaeromonas frigoriresistens]MBS4538927.1 PH domain-containing protein [Anaeromonas frigoriresistens]
MYFPSKRDLWLGVAIFGIIGFTTLFILVDLGITMVSIIMILSFLFAAWLWFGTGYYIEDEMIRIKCGPFRSKVNIKDIELIKKTNNPISSPALSLDRIELKSANRLLAIISPKDKMKFAEVLKEKNPNISIEL